jgi:hypothetical protein
MEFFDKEKSALYEKIDELSKQNRHYKTLYETRDTEVRAVLVEFDRYKKNATDKIKRLKYAIQEEI